MKLRIFYYKVQFSSFLKIREGFLIETEQGWGEVAPLPGWSQENLKEAFHQLKALQEGKKAENSLRNFLPSVAFGLYPCTQAPLSWPASALLMGTPQEILHQAQTFQDFTSAKIKVKNLSLEEAISLVKELKDHFHLRIDANGAWSLPQALEFCSHFQPDDFEYIEDPLSDPKDLVHFPFPMGIDALTTDPSFHKTTIWKPTVKGIPPVSQNNLVLSSAFESGIGIGRLVQLAESLHLPKHPIGLGTYHYLSETLLEEPLSFSKGMVHIPKLRPNLKHVRQLS